METKGEKQSSSERVYKVALVSSSEKFNGAMLPLLPKNQKKSVERLQKP